MGLPTSTFLRGARLAALPAAFAGRTAIGVALKVGGAPAEHVASEIQRKGIEQLCRTLGELKGGALKLGQAMSVFEAVLPEELAKPYRAALNAMQHAAPALPRSAVERVLVEELGPGWPSLLSIDWVPAGAASIGQVHKGVWLADGRAIAVKIQYPGVAKALMSDLRQLRRAARLFKVLGPGIDVLGLIDELTERLVEELDYDAEAANQTAFATAFDGDPLVLVPGVVFHTGKVLVTEWLDGVPLSTRVNDEALTKAERDAIGVRLVHAVYGGPELAGLMHGDPHPGNFMLLPDGRLGVLDFGSVKRLPDGIPAALGRNAALVVSGRTADLRDAFVGLGFLKADSTVTGEDLADYLSAMSEPFRDEAFTFSRAWLRREAVRLGNPRGSEHAAGRELQLPVEYLMIHRVATGMVGLLCQLGATVPLRSLEMRWSPGFRATVAESTGQDAAALLDRAQAVLDALAPELPSRAGADRPGQAPIRPS